MATEKARAKVGEAFLGLLAERPWGEIELAAIAKAAGVSLAQLRAAYDDKLAIWADIVRRFDAKALASDDPAMADEPARDRLFDVLMRRFDVLAPAKPAIRGLVRSAERDPVLAAALAPLAVQSHRWMLAAAGLSDAGWTGVARAQALALAMAPVTRTWLAEDDPGLPRTMAALDQALRRLEGWQRDLRRLGAFLRPFRRRPAPPPPTDERGESAPPATDEPPASVH